MHHIAYTGSWSVDDSQYFRPWARLGEPNEGVLNIAEQQKLWHYLEDEVKTYL